MKVKVSILLALIIVLTVIPLSAFAEENYDKQLKEAIVKSKKLFSIGNEYDKFSHSVYSQNGDIVFNLDWSDSNNKLGGIYVSIASDGTVLGYDVWKPIYDKQMPSLPSISREDGLKIAKDFIKKVSPKFANSIKYMDTWEPINLYSGQYNYSFVRTEKGIPYYNNSINISMDTSSGEVKYYYTNWDRDLVFSHGEVKISLGESQELYKEKIGLEMLYKSNYMYKSDYDINKQETFLVYAPMDTNLGIDAKTGEVIATNNHYRTYDMAEDMGGTKEMKVANELSPGEEQAVEDISGLIPRNEAEKIGREILKLDSSYSLESANIYKNWRNNDYNWQLRFEKNPDSKEYYYGNISINAQTKEIVSFNKYSLFNADEISQVTEEEALKLVKEFIKKTNPDKLEFIQLKPKFVTIEPLENNNNYYFNFIRQLDDAYVESDGISVSVVGEEITNYRVNWSKSEFAPQTDLIPGEKAYDILFNDIGLELRYENSHRYGENIEKNKEAILIYGLKNEKPANIHAKTGIILDNTGEPFKAKTVISYNDIENSYAKDKINVLASYGVILPGLEFKPKEKINQKDFLSLLVKASDPYFDLNSSRNDLYNYVINRGILKEEEKSPENIVTKEEGIKYLIRALKYDKIADLTDIYKDLFEDTHDISPELKGYISIAYGLGIVEVKDNKLYPRSELRREDTADMIYNYLFGGK